MSKGRAEIGQPLPPWQPGTLDIHHLAYGRGDATLVIMPNGASALIDAGAVIGGDPALVPAAKGVGADPGAWIARYARRQLVATGKTSLDAAIITHLHQDHIGQVRRPLPLPTDASHQHTGISAVAAQMDIGTLYDPDWPIYGYPPFEGRASVENYIAFAKAHAASGGGVAKLEVGALIDLGAKAEAPWSLRTVASRGRVWTGEGEDVRSVFPTRSALPKGDWPNENSMSAAFLVSFGPFRYFAGGDLTDWGDAGTRPWMNALTPTAQAIGPVNVSTVPHHGMFDAASADTIRALAARDWVISAWHAVHPSLSTVERLLNQRLYEGQRAIYSTALHPATEQAMKRLTDRFASRRGNLVCRVTDGGARYQMIVTDQDSASDIVTFRSEIRSSVQQEADDGPPLLSRSSVD